MRPIINIKTYEKVNAYPADALLMMHAGEFCMMCERPLPADSAVWSRAEQEIVKGRVGADELKGMLLLCHNCAQEAEKSRAMGIMDESMLYPDREITFALDLTSPFYYTVEKVDQIKADPEGRQGESISREVVLIKGRNEAAIRTIEYFRLNSHYYDSEKNILLMPDSEDSHAQDRRLDLRAQAWRRAEDFLGLFKQTEDREIRAALTVNLRNSIAHSGFWSVWATVFWGALQDKEIMRTLFAQQTISEAGDVRLKAAVPELIGQGPHNHFPGSSDSWLK